MEGEPHAADKPELGQPECFPLALRRRVDAGGNILDEPVEPLAADVRPEGQPWKHAKLKLIAGIIGVAYDELRQRERQRARARLIQAVALGCLIAAAFVLFGMQLKRAEERRLAEAALTDANRLIAERRLLHAGNALVTAYRHGMGLPEMERQLRSVRKALVPQIDVFTAAARRIESLAFSPDGKLLGVLGDDGRISIWNLRPEGALLACRLNTGTRPGAMLKFAPSGGYVISAMWDGNLRMWPFRERTTVVTCTSHLRKIRVNAVDVSPDGLLVVSGGDDTTVKLWDPVTWMPIETHLPEHDDLVKSVAFSPDGSLFASAGFDRIVRIFRASDRTEAASIDARDRLNRAVITKNNDTVVAAGMNGSLRILSISERKIRRVYDRAHSDRINDLVLHPDGVSCLTAADDGYVRRWRLSDGEGLLSIEEHGAFATADKPVKVGVLAIAVSPNGRLVATGGNDGVIKIWRSEPEGSENEALERLMGRIGQRVMRAFPEG